MVPLTCVAHLAVLSLAVSAGARYHSGPQTKTTLPARRPSVILPAGFHLRSWSADHSFLPARRPSVCYPLLWILPLIMVRRPKLSPGPSAVRLLFSSLDTTLDYGPQTTAFSRPVYYTTPRPLPSFPVRRPPISPGPPAVPSIILPAGSYLYKVSRLKI